MSGLPLVEELEAAPAPLDAARSLGGLPHLLLLESSAPVSPISRYSFLTADPVYVIESKDGVTTRRMPVRGETVTLDADPLQAVHDHLQPFARHPLAGLPPFQGGAAGYIGYEYGRQLEKLPVPRFADLEVPDVSIGVYDWTIAWDHLEKRAWIISTGLPALDQSSPGRAGERIRWIRSALKENRGHRQQREPQTRTRLAPTFPVPNHPALRSVFTEGRYRESVQQVIDYIFQGDVFQVNLSQRFEAELPGTSLDLYRRLRDVTPAPFAAFLDFGGLAVASASPERFLHLDPVNRQVETRPIKGTRPRGDSPERDQALRQELLASEKDRAENVMIVDLLRNDLSRVSLPGTVQVPSLLALESHPTVHHLVSTVTANLEPGRTVADLLHATFPGGSITGAPKIRAMEIIAELEPCVRGPYTGALGYWSLTGAVDTSIVIRTFVIVGDRAYFHAGGGIVADSSPEAEYRETLDKAAALIRAVGQ